MSEAMAELASQLRGLEAAVHHAGDIHSKIRAISSLSSNL